MPRLGIGAMQTVKVGFLGPLTGTAAAWGEPGYNGCLIWADRVYSRGGIQVRGQRYHVQIVPYDTENDADRALAGIKKLVL
jgi:branched-chain amino acid transport system substrate-binding protein